MVAGPIRIKGFGGKSKKYSKTRNKKVAPIGFL
jgi:hypothetical protein